MLIQKAAGIRVPIAVGDFLIIRAVNESKGFAMAISDEEIMHARDRVAKLMDVFYVLKELQQWVLMKNRYHQN